MRVPVLSLNQAVEHHFGANTALRATAAARALGLDDDSLIAAPEIGDVLARALFPELEGGGSTPLAFVSIVSGPERATVDPFAAQDHPVLGRWAPCTLDGALAAPVVAAATVANFAGPTPTFGVISVAQVEGRPLYATAMFGLGDGQVTLHFGQFPEEPCPVVSARTVGGDALYALGISLRSAASHVAETAVLYAASEVGGRTGEALGFERPAGVSLH